MIQNQEQIRLDIRNGRANGVLRVVSFKDHQFFVAFSPTLNLSGYGDSEKEALDMLFKDILMDFFENLMKLSKSEIDAELNNYGFVKNSFFRKRYEGRGPIESTSKILTKLNLPAETPVKERYLEVA